MGVSALLLLALQAAAPQLTPGDAPPADWLRGEWIVIAEEADVVVSLDETATRRDGDRVRIRIRALLDPAEYEGARFGITVMEADCRRRTIKGISLAEYDASGRAIVQQSGNEALPEEPWPEGDPTSETFAAVCHRTDGGEEGDTE